MRLPHAGKRACVNRQGAAMPKFAKILLACLICLAVAGGLIWLIQRLFS
jgi:flagellar biogenesis protein FliO